MIADIVQFVANMPRSQRSMSKDIIRGKPVKPGVAASLCPHTRVKARYRDLRSETWNRNG